MELVTILLPKIWIILTIFRTCDFCSLVRCQKRQVIARFRKQKPLASLQTEKERQVTLGLTKQPEFKPNEEFYVNRNNFEIPGNQWWLSIAAVIVQEGSPLRCTWTHTQPLPFLFCQTRVSWLWKMTPVNFSFKTCVLIKQTAYLSCSSLAVLVDILNQSDVGDASAFLSHQMHIRIQYCSVNLGLPRRSGIHNCS